MSIRIDKEKLRKALGIPIVEASYIVYKEGETYYVKSGRTGEVEFSSGDASEAIQWALDRARDEGGVVYLKRGKYIIKSNLFTDSCIRLYSNTSLIGERGAELVVDPAFKPAAELAVVGASDSENIAVKDLTIVGHENITDGLMAFNCRYVLFEGNRILNFREDGISFGGPNAEFAVIRDNYVFNVDIVGGGTGL
jgi:hypothetical protein